MAQGFNLNEEFGQGGYPSWKFTNLAPGASISGTVVDVRKQQQTIYEGPKKGQPSFWDDDETRPVYSMVITLQTDLRDPAIDDDDGKRDVFLNTWGDTFRNVRKATQAHGGQILEGAQVTVHWISGNGSGGKANARKFDMTYQPPAKGMSLNDVSTAPQEAAQPASQPVATPAAPVMQKAPEPAPAAAGERSKFTKAQVAQFASMGILDSMGTFDIVD